MRAWRVLFWMVIIALVLVSIYLAFTSPQASAATNISSDADKRYAWNDASAWWDFYGSLTVTVTSTGIEGYATSPIGEISFDCATSPSGDICATSSYTVSNTNGTLSGYAWNDTVGWISMSCPNSGPCGAMSAPYGVTINLATGDFSGWAWNDIVGWISFNGCNHGSCGLYKVRTSWNPAVATVGYLESSVFDTKAQSGATLNSIIWLGDNPLGGARVDFQVATSSAASDPWNWIGYDGTAATYYGAPCDAGISGGPGGNDGAPPNTPICINPNHVKNSRYLRYKVRLKADQTGTLTPQVDDIILNWSR